jgi:hypothetical protein
MDWSDRSSSWPTLSLNSSCEESAMIVFAGCRNMLFFTRPARRTSFHPPSHRLLYNRFPETRFSPSSVLASLGGSTLLGEI